MRACSGPAPWLLAWVIGTGLQLFQPALWLWQAYAGMVAAALSVWLLGVFLGFKLRAKLRLPSGFALWPGLCAVLMMAFAITGLRAVDCQQQGLDASLEGVDLVVQGVVAELPQRRADGVRWLAEVTEARRADNGQRVLVPASVHLAWHRNTWAGEEASVPMLRVGERWQWPVRLKRPRGLVNPGGFDAALWWWSQGVRATGHVHEGQRVLAVRKGFGWQYPVEQLRQATRDAIDAAVSTPRWAGQIAALLLGDQASISHDDWDVFRITGIAHLMSISGLHITLWASLAGGFIAWVWRQSDQVGSSWCLRCPAQVAGAWGGCGVALAYALFTGWGVPAQRTVVMLCVACVWRTRGWRWPVWERWMLAAVCVCAYDPWALLQSGFWLSFVAVACLFMRPAEAAQTQQASSPKPFWRGAWDALGKLCREQGWITLGLAPLSLWLFHQVSLVGLVVNLFAIPWVTLVVTPLAFLGMLWSPLWILCSGCLQGLMVCLTQMQTWPYAVWITATPPAWLAMLGMAGVWVFMAFPRRLWRWWGLSVLIPLFFWRPPQPVWGSVQLLFADVGQGNAVWVRTASHQLWFDTGPRYSEDSDAGQRVLLPLLQGMNATLDLLVLSHQDSDHTGGALALRRQFPQAKVLSSITESHWLSRSMPMQRCEAGQTWIWDGVVFDVLHPTVGDYEKRLSPNARSCVVRIRAQGQTVLLTADIEALQEQQLVQRLGLGLKADLLLVPHHGSKTSSTEGFIDTVQPRWALFQHGYRNRYGHPAAQVVQRYVSRGIQTLYSPQCGAMHWRSDEPLEVQCETELNRRYWRL